MHNTRVTVFNTLILNDIIVFIKSFERFETGVAVVAIGWKADDATLV